MATKAGISLVFLAFVFFAILAVLQFFRKIIGNREGFAKVETARQKRLRILKSTPIVASKGLGQFCVTKKECFSGVCWQNYCPL